MSKAKTGTRESKVEYRLVPGFPAYRVGDDGSVWSRFKHVWGDYTLGSEWRRLRATRVRAGRTDGSQRLQVTLRRDHKSHKFLVHTLVLTAFVGSRPKGMGCCHFPDRNPLNCRLENLRWGTQKDNAQDQRKHGTIPGGELHHNAKLSNADVEKIRSLGGTMSQSKIASMFGVHQAYISTILRRKGRTSSSHAGRGIGHG